MLVDIWSWICELPNSAESGLPGFLELASSKTSRGGPTRSIRLRADRSSVTDSEPSLTFAVCAVGFEASAAEKTLWVSDTCPLSSDKPFLPLLLQLLQDIISRSPTARESTCPRSQLQKLRPDPVSWIMDSHTPETLSSFFNLVFLTRLFWVCSFDAPSEVGSFYFQSLLAPNLEALSCEHAPVLRTFLTSVGVDAEVCFMRTLGYILAKWLILREVGVGLQSLKPDTPSRGLSFSYATESHGLWILKGYVPVPAMKLTRSNERLKKFPVVEAKDSVLKYVLAHQQLETVIQLEYSARFCEGYIQVNARVDNIRIHVVKLGFGKGDSDLAIAEERHFPSRARIWVGPEVGATYVGGLSLGRSTSNEGTELETHRVMRGTFGKTKVPKVKAVARTSMRTKARNWRWDQDSEGHAAIFDAVLCDTTSGQEVVLWNPSNRGGNDETVFRHRYSGANRPFTKAGSLVLCGDEYGESVGWRLNREMEGSVLKWRIGGQVWLSYLPNVVKSSYYETRLVEWCDEIDLPLIPSDKM